VIHDRTGTTVPKPPTIKDVAQLAGVSAATVSLVLNDVANSRITPSTADRVRSAAAALGYAPNPLARGLRRRRTDVIALISDTITTTPYAVHMIEAVEEVVRGNGLLLFLVNTGGDPVVEKSAVAALARQQVDGYLYACMYHRVVDLPDGLGPNVVLLDARTKRRSVPAVVPDERGGARAAVAEFVAHGHRRIGFVNDAAAPPAAALRLAGYREALKAHGIRFDARLVVDAQPAPDGTTVPADGGGAAAVRLVERAGATALFCFNDRMAVAAYRGLRAHGLHVPADVSVIGFDDQEFVASFADPPLTTVALPHYAMGEWAARALVDRVNGRPVPAETHLMPCQLVRRASVGRPRRGG
jgi:DNA-binding LacI/PurR family transcriptional regulator